MARTNVIITNGNVGLSTPNGFQQVEAWNLGSDYNSTTQYLALSTARRYLITFQNACNSLGAVLFLETTFNTGVNNTSTHCDKPVTAKLTQSIGTCTISYASPAVVTKAGHGFSNGQAISFTTSTSLPAPLVAYAVYYVINATTDTFQISATRGGAAINTTNAGSGTHSLWADRMYKTMTASQLMNAADNTNSGIAIPFEWDTDGLGNPGTSYPVTTAVSGWRIEATQGSGTTGNWSWIASYNTQPCYALWGDNAVTFATNDTVIQKGDNILTLDLDGVTIKGVLGSGETKNAWALIPTRGTDPTTDNVCHVVWDTSAPRTITIDGVIVAGAHSGIRIGTEASPVTRANRAILNFVATVGTQSGYMSPTGWTNATNCRFSIQYHGAVYTRNKATTNKYINYRQGITFNYATPTVATITGNPFQNGDRVFFSTTGTLPTGLSAGTLYYVRNVSGDTFNLSLTESGALVGGLSGGLGTHSISTAVTTTEDISSWQVGDAIFIGGGATMVAGDYYTTKTITQIDGNTFALSSVVGLDRIVTAPVVNITGGYGIKITGSAGTYVYGMAGISNLFVEGCEFDNAPSISTTSTSYSWNHEASNARSKNVIRNNSTWNSSGTSTRPIMYVVGVQPDGIEISNNVAARYGSFLYGSQHTNILNGLGKSGDFIIDGNVQVYSGSHLGVGPTSSSTISPKFRNNTIDGMWTSSVFYIYGINPELTNNRFLCSRSGAGYGALNINNCIGLYGSGNSFQGNALAMYFTTATTINCGLTDTDFGSQLANSQNIDYAENILMQWQEDSPTGDASPTTTYINGLMSGSYFKITDNNDVTSADIKYIPYGILTRTGYGLADTKVWTGTAFDVASSGQYGLKVRPTSSTDSVVYEDNNGVTLIGNNQNKLVTVSARVKINSANYYTGVHANPTLTVIYDGGTEISDVALDTTDDQQLIVNFTPTTTNEAITIKISGATDATGTDAEFYFGEIDANAAEGVFVDTTTLSKWFDGEPLGTRRSIPKPGSVWNEQVSNFQTSGSFGEKENNDLTVDDFVALSD